MKDGHNSNERRVGEILEFQTKYRVGGCLGQSLSQPRVAGRGERHGYIFASPAVASFVL